jgi:hypothetical protein
VKNLRETSDFQEMSAMLSTDDNLLIWFLILTALLKDAQIAKRFTEEKLVLTAPQISSSLHMENAVATRLNSSQTVSVLPALKDSRDVLCAQRTSARNACTLIFSKAQVHVFMNRNIKLAQTHSVRQSLMESAQSVRKVESAILNARFIRMKDV